MGTSRHAVVCTCLAWDHPHAYGDKFDKTSHQHTPLGSSPRVWGQVICFPPALWAVRIIPTRMGTRRCAFCVFNVTRDHPHAYGDKSDGLLNTASVLGSSPRVWGQGLLYPARLVEVGIIPTRMGTRLLLHLSLFLLGDHPHAYGDKNTLTEDNYTFAGSSPRVWGQVSRRK